MAESGVLFRFEGSTLDEQNQRVLVFFDSLMQSRPNWVTDIVPSFDSVMVNVAPLLADHYSVFAWIQSLEPIQSARKTIHHTVAVNYHTSNQFDLTEITQRLGLSMDRVIDLHTSITLRVYAVGFTPGFAYLGELPKALMLPRRASPRVAVPKGAVAIADRYAAIYPSQSPGGWNLLGLVADDIPFEQMPFGLGDTVSFTCNAVIDT